MPRGWLYHECRLPRAESITFSFAIKRCRRRLDFRLIGRYADDNARHFSPLLPIATHYSASITSRHRRRREPSPSRQTLPPLPPSQCHAEQCAVISLRRDAITFHTRHCRPLTLFLTTLDLKSHARLTSTPQAPGPHHAQPIYYTYRQDNVSSADIFAQKKICAHHYYASPLRH